MKKSQQQKGAEAVLSFTDDTVIKERIAKSYRHPELDTKLRRWRNRKEAKILSDCPMRAPKLISADEFSITMQRIEGERLRDVLNTGNAERWGAELGRMLQKLHEKDIIHGDLTTSNVLVDNEGLVLIDFGLSYHSQRREDRAVDLHVLRETLEGTHVDEKEVFWAAFSAGYGNPAILELLAEVESRGRYKEKY